MLLDLVQYSVAKYGYKYHNHIVIGLINLEYPKIVPSNPIVVVCSECTEGIINSIDKL